MKVRAAARVVLMNSEGKAFLLKAQDLNDASNTWWLTCGGGAQLGETPAQTAARELAEEAGIDCEPADLIGPLAQLKTVMEFSSHTLHQDEIFFGLVDDTGVDFDGAVWTDMEKRTIIDARWWSREEIEQTEERIYPKQLCTLMDIVMSGEAPSVPLALD